LAKISFQETRDHREKVVNLSKRKRSPFLARFDAFEVVPHDKFLNLVRSEG
jgi:hypothetical protein